MIVTGRRLLLVLALPGLAAPLARAQEQVPVTTLLVTFLADASSGGRPLAWSTGNGVGITWQTPQPVNPEADGYTLGRTGQAFAILDNHPPIPVTITALGNQGGIERVTLSFDWKQPDYDLLEKALASNGVVLAPFRCSRATEPKDAGNVIFETSAPGKRSVGLAEAWVCRDGSCSLELAVLYQRKDVTSVTCMGH